MRAAAIALALVLAPLAAAAAQTPSPAAIQAESPAIEQGKRLLAAVVSGDEASFLATLHALYPSSKLTDAEWRDMRPNWSKLQYHGVERADATSAALQVFDAARDGWALVAVSVDPAPPHLITGFQLRNGHRPADVPAPPKLQPAALAAAVDARTKAEAAADRFSGVVLVGDRTATWFAGAYGLADRTARTPATLATKFRIGSMNKLFTTVAIMQLVQAGKIDLSAPLGRYLPDYPNAEAAAQVTIGELMTHSGGLGDFFGPEFEANRDTLVDPKDYVARFGPQPLLFKPGTRQAYSNYGFIVLGRVVEAASGQSYDTYVQAHIYGPSGMTGTGARPETEAVPGRAVGYETGPEGLRVATAFQVYRGTPAGGGYSTAGDLMAFARALLAGKLLDADHLNQLAKGGVTMPDGKLAWFDFPHTFDGRTHWGHGGASHGQNADLRIFPDTGAIVVVMANRDPPIAEVLENFISARLP